MPQTKLTKDSHTVESRSMKKLLKEFFRLEERGSSVGREIRCGTATFLTMSYILLVNPQLLSKLGIPSTDIAVSTAIAAATGSLVVGLFGNLPFGLAPGVGLSAYLTYGLVEGQGMSIAQAFTSCLIAGIILLLFSICGISHMIMSCIPHSIKVGTIVGMGLQIAMVGMTSVNLIVNNNMTLVALGDITDYKIWLAVFGLTLIGTLMYHNVKGGILIGILIISVVTWCVERSFPTRILQVPSLSMGFTDYLHLTDFDWKKCLSAIVAFVFVGIIDVGGVVFGMAKLADLVNADDSVPGSFFAFLGVSLSTILGAGLGSTPVIIYVESAAGIKEGGRSGLTAVVVAGYFILSLFLAPLFASVPVTATSPVSILVGVLMMAQSAEVNWDDLSVAIPAFVTMTMIPLTYSITNGIVFGLITAIFFYVSTGKILVDMREGLRRLMTGRDATSSSRYEMVSDRSPVYGSSTYVIGKVDNNATPPLYR